MRGQYSAASLSQSSSRTWMNGKYSPASRMRIPLQIVVQVWPGPYTRRAGLVAGSGTGGDTPLRRAISGWGRKNDRVGFGCALELTTFHRREDARVWQHRRT